MEIILTHEQADFDAAGSELAAWLLDPLRVPILPKRRNRNLAAFIEDYQKDLPFVTWRTIPKGKVTRVYITDTQNIAPHKKMEGVSDVIVWDHHPHRHVYPDRGENIYENTGACTTFLVEKLAEHPESHPGRIFSTLMLMGIYEDTGFLSYGSTTPRDIRAAAWLVEHGADLDLMRRYVLTPLTDHQQQACDMLMRNCESYRIRNHQILIASADVREISDEFAAVAHYLRDQLAPDGLILLLGTKSGVRVICRGITDAIDFSGLMKQFNGGGHARAASGLIPIEAAENFDMSLKIDHLKEEILHAIPDHIVEEKMNLWNQLNDRLLPDQRDLIGRISATAEQMEMPVYIVGGVVRDLLLDRPMMDFDIVVEGDATRLGKQLVASYGGRLTVHQQFFTAKWELPDGSALDLISARSETYEAPAVLPTVTPGTMNADLQRRDFTINTLAIRLDGEGRGELTDRCGGLNDLRKGLIRTLHERSFIDDPTRMFRAVRFEQRFDFNLEPDTLRQLREQVGGVENLTGQRIWHELKLYCAELCPEDDFARIVQLGIAARIHPELTWTDEMEEDCIRFRTNPPESCWNELDQEIHPAEAEGPLWIWLSSCPPEIIPDLGTRLLIPKKTLHGIGSLAALRGYLPYCAVYKDSKITFMLDSMPLSAIYCYSRFCASETERFHIRQYLTVNRKITPELTGDDLLKMGIQPGPEMAKLLRKLRAARIDGEIHTTDEEILWLEQFGQKDL